MSASEGSAFDGSVPDGSVTDDSVSDGSVPDGSVSDGDESPLFARRLGVLGFQACNLACYAIMVACAVVMGSIAKASNMDGGFDVVPMVRVVGWAMTGLAMIVVGFVFFNLMRRLNDLNCRRWWIFLSFVPPVNIFLHLWLHFWPGSDDANRFGQAPLPEVFERVMGCIGLCVTVVMMGAGSTSLIYKSSGMPSSSPPADAYQTKLDRFAEAAESAVPIVDEAMFRERIVDRAAFFVGRDVDAPMVFQPDGTLVGSFTQYGGEPDDADLQWLWQGGELCHEGRIARVRIPRACGVARHVPGVGLVVEYEEPTRRTNRWILGVSGDGR